MNGRSDLEQGIKSPGSKSPVMGVTSLMKEQVKQSTPTQSAPPSEGERRASGGILRLDPTKPRRRSSATSIELRNEDPASPCPSDRLSVTWADGEKSLSSETSITLRNKQDVVSENPSITTLLPASAPRSPTVTTSPSNPAKDFLREPELDDDLEASVSVIIRRSSSMRMSKKKSRRKSTLASISSGETGANLHPESSAEKMKLFREILTGVKHQPWPMKKKLRLARIAKEFLKKHEGELVERLAQSSSTKDVLYRYFISFRRVVESAIAALYNWFMSVELWQGRIKSIESHFGSAVASYFTFLRWVIGLNAVIAIILAAFVIIPEALAGDWAQSGERKRMLREESYSAYDLKILWDFEGILRYSPVFYGFYGNKKSTKEGYRLPLAYILTSMCVYGYSFVAILRKMAANSRMSKLGDADETVFTFRLFASWDFTIGNTEAAQNKVASINIGFRESLLEAREADKEEKNWKLTARRALAHFIIMCLILGSAYAVILLVDRSKKFTGTTSWWRRNELPVTLNLISLIFPSLFELVGSLELHHPRKQLQWQLARIMVLNLLNLYTLIFALFGEMNDMSAELIEVKDNLEKLQNTTSYSTDIMELVTAPSDFKVTLNESVTPGLAVAASILYGLNISTTAMVNVSSTPDSSDFGTSDSNATVKEYISDGIISHLEVSPGCKKIRIPCASVPPSIENDTNLFTDAFETTIETPSLTTELPFSLTGESISLSDVAKTESFLNIPNLLEITSEINNTNIMRSRVTTYFLSNVTKASTVNYIKTDLNLITEPSLSVEMTDVSESNSNDSLMLDSDVFPLTTDTTSISLDNELNESEKSPLFNFGTSTIHSTSTDQSEGVQTEVLTTSVVPTTVSSADKDHNFSKLVGALPYPAGPFHILFSHDSDPKSNISSKPLLERSERWAENNNSDSDARREKMFNSTLVNLVGNENSFQNKKKREAILREGSLDTLNSVKPILSHFHENLPASLNSVDNLTAALIHDDTVTTVDDLVTGIGNINDSDDFSGVMDLYLVGHENFSLLSFDSKLKESIFNEIGNSTNDLFPPSTSSDLFDNETASTTNYSTYSTLAEELSGTVTSTEGGDTEHNYNSTDGIRTTSPVPTTTNDTYNTEEYPHYLDGIYDSNQDCFILIEQCDNTTEENSSQPFDGLISRNFTSNISSSSETYWNTTSMSYDKSTMDLTSPEIVSSRTISLQFWVRHLPAENRTRLRKLCWETMFGQEIVKLAIMDLILTVAIIIIGDYIRAVIVRIFNRWCCWDLEKQFPGYPDFKIAENILHLVNNQGQIWMGMFFSPALPAINLAKLVILLYVRSWAVVTSNVPPETVFKASDNNNFYLALLLIMLFLCTLPVGYAVVWCTPSWHCGPFSNFRKIYQLATETLIQSLPKMFEPIIDYISSPGVVIPAGLLLVLIIYYLISLTAALREAVQDLKDQLRTERDAEKRKVMEARSNKKVETPTTRWARLIPLTPLTPHKFDKLKFQQDDDKVPLLGDQKQKRSSSSPPPDDTTDPGQSEVFDDSLSEPKKTYRDSRSKIDRTKDASTQNGSSMEKKQRQASLIRDDKKRRGSRESSGGSLPRSPRMRSKHKHHPKEPLEESPSKMTRTRKDSPKNRDEQHRRSSKEHHKDSPKRPKNSQHRQHETDYADGRDNVSRASQEIEKITEEYPELGDIYESKSMDKDKYRKHNIKSPTSPEGTDKDESPQKHHSGHKHKRDKPILTMSDVHNGLSKIMKKKDGSKKQKKEKVDKRPETPEMQSIPVIKISKEDSVERSIQQAKLERQSQAAEEEEPGTEQNQDHPQSGEPSSPVATTEEVPKKLLETDIDEPIYQTVDETKKKEEEPVKGEEEPVKGEEEPVKGEEEPVKGEEEPVKGEEEPVKGEEELSWEISPSKEEQRSESTAMTPELDKDIIPADVMIDSETPENLQQELDIMETSLHDDDATGSNENTTTSSPRYRRRKPPKLTLPTAVLAQPEDDDDDGFNPR